MISCSVFNCVLRLYPPPVIRTTRTNDRISRNLKNKITNPEVSTNTGKVQGYYMEVPNERIISAFEGIPYAEAPTGPYRFKVSAYVMQFSLIVRYEAK